MEFFSKFGYNYGFEGSDEEDFTEENKSTKRKIRKADSNILSIKIDKLIDSKNEPTSIKAIKCISPRRQQPLSLTITAKTTTKKIIPTCRPTL